MALAAFRWAGPAKPWVLAGWRWDARFKIERIQPHLKPEDRILDIGSGFGLVSSALRTAGYSVSACDLVDQSEADGMRPDIITRDRLPYDSQTFDVGLLLTVLHHVADQEALLREAMRVADRLIIIEDVYTGEVQRRLTHVADSVMNLEFRGHPHSNRTDIQWRALFGSLGLEIANVRTDRFLGLFRQNTYALRSGSVTHRR